MLAPVFVAVVKAHSSLPIRQRFSPSSARSKVQLVSSPLLMSVTETLCSWTYTVAAPTGSPDTVPTTAPACAVPTADQVPSEALE